MSHPIPRKERLRNVSGDEATVASKPEAHHHLMVLNPQGPSDGPLLRCCVYYYIIIIITSVIIITFMQGIYNDIPETNHVSRVYSVAAVRHLQFVLHVMLHRMLNVLHIYISTSRSICAVPNMAVL
jgi:hypothetical protein